MKCREVLCEHIRRNLGISVKTVHLRLKPKPHDKYHWKLIEPYNDDILKLFQNGPNQIPFSGLPKRAHETLQRYVGCKFEALANETFLSTEVPDQDGLLWRQSDSVFTEKIAVLEAKQAELEDENGELKANIEFLEDRKRTTEETLARERGAWDTERGEHFQEAENLKSTADNLRLLIRRFMNSVIGYYQIPSRLQQDEQLPSIKELLKQTDMEECLD
ncbi:hypothetical protein N7474_010098 [Penicillium riverlandense]|uniref:uncharacterized protein n=1 Tax=Penicillium riverlandense TaxID=1903569 RepID=UPI002546A8C8|nr:uncharacterized protein N7474_010098 [Penicillium riverlandense]KAJ5808829.1 hypothetical protein N7474_010098 [Penicillium riverlandense]